MNDQASDTILSMLHPDQIQAYKLVAEDESFNPHLTNTLNSILGAMRLAKATAALDDQDEAMPPSRNHSISEGYKRMIMQYAELVVRNLPQNKAEKAPCLPRKAVHVCDFEVAKFILGGSDEVSEWRPATNGRLKLEDGRELEPMDADILSCVDNILVPVTSIAGDAHTSMPAFSVLHLKETNKYDLNRFKMTGRMDKQIEYWFHGAHDFANTIPMDLKAVRQWFSRHNRHNCLVAPTSSQFEPTTDTEQLKQKDGNKPFSRTTHSFTTSDPADSAFVVCMLIRWIAEGHPLPKTMIHLDAKQMLDIKARVILAVLCGKLDFSLDDLPEWLREKLHTHLASKPEASGEDQDSIMVDAETEDIAETPGANNRDQGTSTQVEQPVSSDASTVKATNGQREAPDGDSEHNAKSVHEVDGRGYSNNDRDGKMENESEDVEMAVGNDLGNRSDGQRSVKGESPEGGAGNGESEELVMVRTFKTLAYRIQFADGRKGYMVDGNIIMDEDWEQKIDALARERFGKGGFQQSSIEGGASGGYRFDEDYDVTPEYCGPRKA